MKKILGSLAALIILSTSGQVFGAARWWDMPAPDFTKGEKNPEHIGLPPIRCSSSSQPPTR